jgi:hypothetical protein
MAETVINNPSAARERTDEGSAVAGWAAALLILAAVILGALYILPRLATPAATTPQGIDVNVSLPEGAIPGTNTNTNQGGQQQQGGTQNPTPTQ